jgi:hypothetical protein
MPKKKKSSAPQGLSPQQTAQANKQGFDHAMDRLPPIGFEDMFSNFEMFSGGLGDMFGSLFGGLIDRGENTIGVADRNETTATEQLTEALNPQPQIDPYEARIKVLMDTRGMTRQEAIANQQNALGLKTDYNNDGAVTDDEWRKYGQTAPGASYIAQHPGRFNPQRQQPTAPQPGAPVPGMPTGAPQVPGIPNLTPEQLAALQKMNGYGRGVA